MTNTKQGRFEPGAKSIAFSGVEACAKRRAMPCAPLVAGRFAALFLLAIALLAAAPARAADTLNWETKRDRVSADIKSGKLMPLLEQIASVTGWQVFVEPDTVCTISAKFNNLPPGEALHLLLGDLNFALVPQTNAGPKLVVFRTLMKNATQLVHALNAADSHSSGKAITNELIVRLKPGAKIDELARSLGAKVIGRIDSLGAYRLQFEDQAAADTARQQLAANPNVASVDSNYSMDRPAGPIGAQSSNLPPPPQLQLKPPPSDGRVIVGLVDTALQPLGNGLDSFLLKAISVAGDAQLDPNNPTHGTSMAETILGSLATMTKGSSSVQILPVDVYGPNVSTTTFDVANGIAQAVNGGANPINLSLGSAGNSPFLDSVIQDASSKNIVFIAAAGNTPVTTPFYPAAYSGVMAVTAIDQGQLASYANRGSFVSLGAPGTSLIYFDSQPYYVTGTSASAAFISGMAAGYMDSTHNSASQMQTFLRSNFGVKIVPSP
jgi:thermitase